MPKQKNHQTNSNYCITRKRRNLQGYFEQQGYFLTPNQRSLPKKKALFHNSKKTIPKKKIQMSSRRNSAAKPRKSNKKQFSPNHVLSKQRHEHSIHRQYDSPSKDQEQLQFILAQRPKKGKNGAMVQKTIEKVNEKLKRNQLPESIDLLQQALTKQPNSYDLNYLLGVCYLINSSYDEAINTFDNLLRKKPRKNIYLLLSVCYKKMDELQLTEKILDDCLTQYPKYYQGYIYRGKLFLKQKKYKKALIDFDKAISLNSNKQIGYIGKGDCLRLMERYQQAKSVYSIAINSKQPNPSILLRRSICNMQLKRYDIAFDDIDQLISIDPQNSQTLYFRGLIFSKQKMENDAIICYEQAIKFNTNKKAVTRSIYELSKIKIQHRDYYEALYTLERAQHLDIDEKVIKRFKGFTDGVTEMMKKNFEKGLAVLNELLEIDDKPLSNFLRPLFYAARSYGNMSLQKFSQAKNDFEILERDFSLDLPNYYNKFICQGILACNAQKYQQALAFFSKAGKTIPQRLQPAFYKAVTLICFASKLIPKNMKEKRKQYLESALKTIQKVQTPIENNPSLFLVRGFIYFALDQQEKAYHDLDQYIRQSTTPCSLVFYLNGLILGSMNQYHEAIDEFKKALNVGDGKDLPQIYLNRAKCMLLVDQVNAGFVDLQKYMSYRPSSPDIHIWAGHLLFKIGACDDAAKAYSNVNNISKNFQVLFYRAKCYLACKDVISTISNLKMMLQIKYDSKIFFDHKLLESLRECSEDAELNYGAILKNIKQVKRTSGQMGNQAFGELFKQQQYQFFKGVLYFFDQKYDYAAKNFKRALEIAQKYIEQNAISNEELLDFYKLDFNNKCFNYYEIIFNMAIAQVCCGNSIKALKYVKSIVQKIPSGQIKKQFELLANLLTKECTKLPQSNKQQRNDDLDQQQAQFLPFPSQNRLCSIFPEFSLPLSVPIRTRLYFCLPYIQKPDIKPKFDEKLLQQFDMKRIQVKPQAPWIKRSQKGVIFTDQVVQNEDIELSASQQSQKQKNQSEQEDLEEQQQQQIYHYDNHRDNDSDRINRGEYSDEEPAAVMMNPNQLKEFFKLDKATEQRLNKIKEQKF